VRTIETAIKIDASPQTVWSIMDDLQNYPAWNRLTADLAGRTTVGSIVRGTLTKGGNSPPVPLSPTITAIVGAREFRWLTAAPGFHAEHYFLLSPTADGGTELIHNEDFDGPVADERWGGIQASSPPAYNQFNADLKARAEAFRDASVSLHPAVDSGLAAKRTGVSGAELRCLCAADPVVVAVSLPIYHNHLCGCSKCWKPEGAMFAQTAVVVREGVQVTENDAKLALVDPNQSIQRHACRECGTHMLGSVADPDHHFFGLAFIHPELASDQAGSSPEFAGFVSSVIETGTSPSLMSAVRRRLTALQIPAFDAFSPELMDIIAWHKCKLAHYPQATE
jgi:S-(hydroxymethyl)glutathione synthase